ncbi:MAG: hypothetical protein CV090_04010 [Nitrospira sp. WS238]|nr:hypothetical protein [Nitrospira sp. WS238]
MGRVLLAFNRFILFLYLITQFVGSHAEAQTPAALPWTMGAPLERQFFSATGPHAPAEVFHTTVASNVMFPSVPTSRLRDLTPDSQRPRIEQLLATTTLLSGQLSAETEVAQSPTGMAWGSSLTENARTDVSARMFRIGVTGSEGSLRYGMTFRQAGQGFLMAPDRANREVWSEWKAGWVTFRNAVGQTWNNVEGEPTRSRFEQTYGRAGLVLAKPSWPEVSVTYVRNSLSSMFDPIGVAPQRSANHGIEGAMSFHRTSWDLRIASSYTLASDLLSGDADSAIKAQTLSAALRPINRLIITPAFTYRQESRPRSGVRIENPGASLVVSYEQSPDLRFSTVGNYGSSRSSDGLINIETLRWKGIMDWAPYTSLEWTTKIAFEAGYNRLSNRVSRSNDLEDISGLVRLGIVAH